MTTIVTIAAGDQITNSRADLNTNFSNLNSDKIETSVIDTDSTLSANSDSKIPSQKAIKAYVDAVGTISTGLKQTLVAGATINGATTPVPVYQNKTDNEVYACDGNDIATLKFMGFAVTNGTNGNPIDVVTTGLVSGFTGLAEGEKYYLQDAVGTIGTSPGTYEVLVGIAISETELVLQKGSRFASGALTLGTTVSDEVLSIGFRPSIVRIVAHYQNAADSSAPNNARINLVWTVFSGVVSAGAYHDEGTGGGNLNNGTLHSATGNYVTIGVGTITDTGFTITLAETGTFAGNGMLIWEAEGDY